LVECRRRQRWRGLDLPPSDLAEPQTPLRRGPLTRRQTQSVDRSRSAVLPDELPDSLAGPWPRQWLWSRAASIAGGTSEIQRDIIAGRILRLPR